MIPIWMIIPINAHFFHPNIDINKVWIPFYYPKFIALANTVNNIPETPKIGNRLIIIAVIKYCHVYANWIRKLTINMI